MKTSLKFLALVLAAGFPCAAFAETLGARIPSVFAAENMVGVFFAVSMILLVNTDYSRSARLTATSRVTAKSRSAEAHRLAA